MANKRNGFDLCQFAQDIYDVLGRNTMWITQKQFYDKYVAEDEAFMIHDEGDEQIIYFDDFKITITRN